MFGADNDRITVKGVPCDLYMHLEYHGNEASQKSRLAITLKLGIRKSKDELEAQGLSFSNLRNELVYGNDWNYKLGAYHFNRPARLGNGAHITLGVYDGDCSTAGKCEETLQMAVKDYLRVLGDLQ